MESRDSARPGSHHAGLRWRAGAEPLGTAPDDFTRRQYGRNSMGMTPGQEALGYAAQSVAGRVRDHNEDALLCRPALGLWAVADGMGGHPEGEVAAQLALQTISALYQREARPVIEDTTEFLSAALMAAHHQIIRYASEKGMLDTP
eukprot:gene9660-11850_t